MPPWWCNERQRKASVCCTGNARVKEKYSVKAGVFEHVYTHGESANPEPNRVPIQVQVMSQKTIMTLE